MNQIIENQEIAGILPLVPQFPNRTKSLFITELSSCLESFESGNQHPKEVKG